MIKFKRLDNKVLVQFEHGIFYSDDFFECELVQSKDYQAELLTQAFHENLDKHLINIKEKYYNLGVERCQSEDKKKTIQ